MYIFQHSMNVNAKISYTLFTFILTQHTFQSLGSGSENRLEIGYHMNIKFKNTLSGCHMNGFNAYQRPYLISIECSSLV